MKRGRGLGLCNTQSRYFILGQRANLFLRWDTQAIRVHKVRAAGDVGETSLRARLRGKRARITRYRSESLGESGASWFAYSPSVSLLTGSEKIPVFQ